MSGAKDLLIECQQYCVQANNTLTDDASRNTLQESLEGILGSQGTAYKAATAGSLMRSVEQTVWMGQPILNGKLAEGPFPKGNITAQVENFQGKGAFTTFAATTGAVATDLIDFAKTVGVVEGKVSSVSATTNATDSTKIDIQMTIGTSIYKGESLDATGAATEWLLKGDNGSLLTLLPSSGGSSLAPQTVEKELKEAFGLLQVGSDLTVPAKFVASSVAAQPADYTLSFDEKMPSGTYGVGVSMVDLGAGVVPALVVSNGTAGSVQEITAAGAYSAFGGGITVNFAAVPGADIANHKFEVENYLPFYCQTGATSNDVLEGKLPRVDLTSLGLANESGVCDLNLGSMDTATIASERVSLALARLSAISANIGTIQAQATTSAESSSTLYSNITDAATVYDAVDAPVMISKSIAFALRSANAVNSISPGFTMSIQLKNQLANANQLATQA